jgi:hypothetical protein
MCSRPEEIRLHYLTTSLPPVCTEECWNVHQFIDVIHVAHIIVCDLWSKSVRHSATAFFCSWQWPVAVNRWTSHLNGGASSGGAECDNPVCLSVCLCTSLAPQCFTASCLYLDFMGVFVSSKYEMNLKVIIYKFRPLQMTAETNNFTGTRFSDCLCVQGKQVRSAICCFRTVFLLPVRDVCDTSCTLLSQTERK